MGVCVCERIVLTSLVLRISDEASSFSIGCMFIRVSIGSIIAHPSPLFVNSPRTGKGLTQLDVSQNQLQNVPQSALKNLHHLLILNLNHNKISVIHNRAFEGLDTLEILTLYENRITGVEPDAFRGLDK